MCGRCCCRMSVSRVAWWRWRLLVCDVSSCVVVLIVASSSRPHIRNGNASNCSIGITPHPEPSTAVFHPASKQWACVVLEPRSPPLLLLRPCTWVCVCVKLARTIRVCCSTSPSTVLPFPAALPVSILRPRLRSHTRVCVGKMHAHPNVHHSHTSRRQLTADG